MAFFDAPDFKISPETDFGVYPDNWQAVQLFLSCSTQWRSAGMGGLIGLDYNAVDLVLRLHGQQSNPELFHQLQIMEQAVLTSLHDK